MPELERSLDSLRPAEPGALPPLLVGALRSTRRKRRATVITGAACGLISALAVTIALSRARTEPPKTTIVHTNPHPAPPTLPTFAALTRANRDLDPERLILPESAASSTNQVLPTRFGAREAASESLLN